MADFFGWEKNGVLQYPLCIHCVSEKANRDRPLGGCGLRHFLIGSDLPGTMTPVSKLAFASLDVAKRYQKEHGGSIGTLDDALQRAIEGRGEDMAVIKKKKAVMAGMGKKLAGKYGCYKCHGDGGAGGEAIAWNSPEFAKEMDNRVKIKQQILGGSHNMPGYKGKIPEKPLHAITIYIWTQRAK